MEAGNFWASGPTGAAWRVQWSGYCEQRDFELAAEGRALGLPWRMGGGWDDWLQQRAASHGGLRRLALDEEFSVSFLSAAHTLRPCGTRTLPSSTITCNLSGPCGPCSELYYDFHPDRGCGQEVTLEDDSRFIEYYNLVGPTVLLGGSG